MGGLEAVITGIEDEFKIARRLSRGSLTALVIFSSFFPALISCTQGGAYTLFWFDIYTASVSLLFSALFEAVGVVYFYGIDKFIVDIESMLGRRPHIFYILCWKYISPIFLLVSFDTSITLMCTLSDLTIALQVIIFMSIYTAPTPVYRGYTFPLWSIISGWCLAFSSVIAVPIVAIWYNCFQKNKDRKSLRSGGSVSASSSRHGKRTPNHHRSVSVRSLGGQPSATTTVLTPARVDYRIGEDIL